MAEIAELCSKCKKNPRAHPGSSNPWCKECKAKYQQEFREGEIARAESAAFVKGIDAMRNALRTAFAQHRHGVYYGHDVMRVIEDFPRPPQPQ